MHPSFAGIDSLVPGMLKLCVASSATVFEPSTAATTTTALTGFRDGTTFRAYGNGNRCGGCYCLCVGIDQTHKEEKTIVFTVESERTYLHQIEH